MLTVIIIAKNEAEMIPDCLSSVAFADEVLVVDSGSTDTTVEIAKKHKAKVIHSSGTNYSAWRNDGIKAAKGDWLLFVDADERVTPELAQELSDQCLVPSAQHSAYLIPRKNNYLGKFMNYGGWGNEKLIRLFKRRLLKGYSGDLHEQPKFDGTLGEIKNSLLHYSHRDLTSMLQKTITFTKYEAQLRFEAGHPPIVAWRFVRVMFTEFWLRFIKLSAWRDGTPGVIDGLFQVFNMFIIYARLWELQQHAQKSSNS